MTEAMTPVVVTLGSVGAGKSCLLFRYQYERFCSYASGSAGCSSYTVITEPFENIPSLTFDLYDTAFSLRQRLQQAAVALIVFDVTSKASFQQVCTQWVSLVKETAPRARVFLVGTKVDKICDRQVARESAKFFAERNNFLYRECSAVTGQNVDNLFQDIAYILHNMTQQGLSVGDSDSQHKSKNRSLLNRIKYVLPQMDLMARFRRSLDATEESSDRNVELARCAPTSLSPPCPSSPKYTAVPHDFTNPGNLVKPTKTRETEK